MLIALTALAAALLADCAEKPPESQRYGAAPNPCQRYSDYLTIYHDTPGLMDMMGYPSQEHMDVCQVSLQEQINDDSAGLAGLPRGNTFRQARRTRIADFRQRRRGQLA